jgi:hypothetical protein
MNKLNRNVDVPLPKCLNIVKAALLMQEYDHLRGPGKPAVFDLKEPADPVDLSGLTTSDL